MPHETVPKKHIKTLNRRLTYLESLQDSNEANSYDLAEIAALRAVLGFVQFHNITEEVHDDYYDEG
jgi:hypothetical protein